MIYLLLSIFFSVVSVSFFKLFEHYKVKTFNAIAVNYLSCFALGNFLSNENILTEGVWQEPWVLYAIILGVLFISIFYTIGKTSQLMGMSVSMVSAKLSVVIPVFIAVFFFNETFNLIKLSGVITSLVAVVLISLGKEASQGKSFWVLPLIVFLGSGLIDSLLNYIDMHFIPPADAATVITTVFGIAGILGIIVLLLNAIRNRNKSILLKKEIFWGIALGIPNYFSMYFLLKTIGHYQEASFIFPINNIAIAGLSTLVSYRIFKENLTKHNIVGLLLAFVSILILSFR